MPNAALPLTVAGLFACAGSAAQAAGGHFDVDDASVLDPGRCQIETWFARASAVDTDLAHLDAACRAGPVEVGLNFDSAHSADTRRSGLGPQIKWVASPLLDGLSAGIVWSVSFDIDHGGAPAQTLYLPATWQIAERWWLHANLGVDRGFSGARTRRLGGSVEWKVAEPWTLIAERVQIAELWASQLGTRLNLGASSSIDLSAARVGPNATRVYVLGLNHEFAR